MNFTKMCVIVSALAVSQFAAAQNFSIGGGWSKTSWKNNSNNSHGGNRSSNGSVTNSWVGGNLNSNSNGGWGGGREGYAGWGSMGGGCYSGNTIIVVPYSPFTNTWGNPCYAPQMVYVREVVGCCSPQYIIR